MEIRAKCSYNLDAIKALTRLSMFKKANPKKRMILWSALYSILLVLVLLEMHFIHGSSSLRFYLIVVIAVPALLFFWYFILPRIQYRGMNKLREIENEYIFCDEKVCIRSNSDDFHGTAEVNYAFFL